MNMKVKILPIAICLFASLFTTNTFAQFFPKIYKSPEMRTQSFAKKTIAILPVFVDIQDMRFIPDRNHIYPGNTHYQEAINQQEIYGRLLTRKHRNKFVQTIQDVNVTNRILTENGITSNEKILSSGYKKLAKILNVDAVLVCSILKAPSRTPFGAAALSIIREENVPTGVAGVAFTLYDGKTENAIYKYEKFMRSYYNRSLNRTTSVLVRKATRRMKFKV